jgi:hypothetical protein
MKNLPLSLTLLTFSAAPLFAQTAHTTTHPPVHPAPVTQADPSVPACVEVPQLSPKIPALPADAPCAKHLYSITTIPSVKLENVSPMETTQLAEKLGIERSTFSLDYIDTKIGDGPLAAPDKWYSIHYTGYLVDGTKFDSSLPTLSPLSSSTAATRSSRAGTLALTACTLAASGVSLFPFSSPTAHRANPPSSLNARSWSSMSSSSRRAMRSPHPSPLLYLLRLLRHSPPLLRQLHLRLRQQLRNSNQLAAANIQFAVAFFVFPDPLSEITVPYVQPPPATLSLSQTLLAELCPGRPFTHHLQRHQVPDTTHHRPRSQ